ncbi:MAG TPA: FecR domain-containing protein [Usitatibacter sp.]|nr:FecR domain-containing protein [Usitatibacter sp.]
MKRPVRNKVNRLLIAALAATPLLAGAASGEFTFVTGDVGLIKKAGQRVTPQRGTPVDAGDRITTGPNGMAQLTMVDQARLSLRPNTQFAIEAYPEQKESAQGAILSLFQGTLRTFTGLLASTNRDKFVMKTRVATVGIRGSGNILYACEPGTCDESVAAGRPNEAITVNHTIEGSHSVSNIGDSNLPAQQGGVTTLITGPGQTVLVLGNQAPTYIPTPRFIADAATTMASAKPATVAGAITTQATGDTRNFSPSDTPALPPSQQPSTQVFAANPVGLVNPINAIVNLGADPISLRDIILTVGSPFGGQATQGDITADGNNLRSYRSYAGNNSGVNPAIIGGTLAESNDYFAEGVTIFMGRYNGASLSLSGPGGGGTPVAGSLQWIYANSGYPTYLSDVLTGGATYTLVAATSPTNQVGTAGTLGSASLSVDFTNRMLGLSANVSIPAAGSNAGGNWRLNASNVPIAQNSFISSTSDTLVINNGSATSTSNHQLTGSVGGSFVGNGLGAVILGYGIQDVTSSNANNWNTVSGVAALAGDRQQGSAPFVEGRISDPTGSLPDLIRSYAATDRTTEIVLDSQNRIVGFNAPFEATGGANTTYSLGSAQVVESGFDAETGLTWGRWGGGQATAVRNGQSVGIDLTHASLHYIFASAQAGPVNLPLTGSAIYDVVGSTTPTSGAGDTGHLNSASLAANFTNRTVDAAVNISIAGQTWTGTANNMPIYRDQYFSAYSGSSIPGLPNPNPLVIGCSPSCGSGATGSFDGFFTGRSGQGAGMMYNLGGNQGAVAFRNRNPGGG